MAEDGKPETREEGHEPDFSAKHPLETKWTLWFDNPKGKQHQSTWGQTLRPVYTFGTVEDFWGLYNNVLPPSRLSVGSDLHLFRDGVEPKWEDPTCAAGGKWLHPLPKAGGSASDAVDAAWLHVALAVIGEHFADGDEVCGVVINVRPRESFRIALWTRTASNEAVQIALGKQLKQLLNVPEAVKISYITHSDAKSSNKPTARYVV